MRSRRRLPRLDKTRKKQILILILIFVGSFILFSVIFNLRKVYATSEMEKAALPTISSEAFNTNIGELHGYKDEMDACYMRDSVIPLGSDRRLPLSIDTHGNSVDSISYEIRSTDMERKIAETEVKDYDKSAKDRINLNIQIENLTEEGTEYLFIVKLKCSGDVIRYYTRILIVSTSYLINFISFHLFSK